MYLKPELKDQLVDFCKQMLATRDYDPNYFAVKGYAQNVGLTRDETYEFCFVFNGFYHFGSAERYWQDRHVKVEHLPYGRSRRGFRGNQKVLNFIQGGLELKRIIERNAGDGEAGWLRIYNMLLQIPGCGHWSAFYLCDMFKVVLGFKITSPDVGYLSTGGKNRGPIAGLAFVTGFHESTIRASDGEVSHMAYEELLDAGAPFTGMEEFESILCNFLSLHKGSYYVGRDIDRQMKMMEGLGPEWWSARERYFPRETLGEFNGWSDIRKEKMGTFEPGKIWTHDETHPRSPVG